MNMTSSSEDVAFYRPENLDLDLCRLIGLSKDFVRLGPLPSEASITCTFRALLDWIRDDDPEQALRLESRLLKAGMTKEVMSAMEVKFVRCDDPQPESRP